MLTTATTVWIKSQMNTISEEGKGMRKNVNFREKEEQLKQQGIKKTRVRKRKEYLDYDYIENLSEENKQYLKKFSREYYGGNFDEVTLHSEEQKNELWNDNNRLNADIYGTAKSLNKLISIEDEIKYEFIIDNETSILDKLMDCETLSKTLGIPELDILFIMDAKRQLNEYFCKYKIPEQDMIDYFSKLNGNRFKNIYKITNIDHFFMRKHLMGIKRILTKNQVNPEILLKNLEV